MDLDVSNLRDRGPHDASRSLQKQHRALVGQALSPVKQVKEVGDIGDDENDAVKTQYRVLAAADKR
jgi:hypothetical protein